VLKSPHCGNTRTVGGNFVKTTSKDMKKIKELDITITSLNKLAKRVEFATVEDIILQTQIEKLLQQRILEYLNKSNYCEKVSNAYKITFEGEYLIDKTIFPFKNRPFLVEKIYKQIKFTALLSNMLLVLALGIMNYRVNKEKAKDNKKVENKQQIGIVSDSLKTKIDTTNIKNDTANIKVK
jgi:hypothetical protein